MKDKTKLINELLRKNECKLEALSTNGSCEKFVEDLNLVMSQIERDNHYKAKFLKENCEGLLILLNANFVVKEVSCSDDYHCLFLEDEYQDFKQPIEFLFKAELAEKLREHIEKLRDKSSFVLPLIIDENKLIFEVFLSLKNNSVMCLVRNISQNLNTKVSIDDLTGLPNRTSYYRYLEDTIEFSKENNCYFGILFFDLDRFKIINDSLGHRVGDELLIAVGNRLKNNLRENEFVARLSGDEFTVVVKNISYEDEVIETANRIISLFKNSFTLTKHSLEVKSSIGVSIYPLHSEKIDVLVQYADTAMYTAKELGGNQVCVFNKIQSFRVRKNFKMEQGLRKAIYQEEVYLVYQPKFDCDTKQITGMEALVRWKPKDYHEAISPAEFIPLAELTGYINELGLWIIDQVCAQINQWKKRKINFHKVSINISRSQLIDTEIVNVIFSIMKLYGVEGNELIFEITEDSIIQNNESAMQNLKLFNDAGIQIAIDDFGSGYSSFYDLKTFPFSELKIDKSIIDYIGKDKKNDAIVRAIISMGIEMDMKVVAEGVESLNQLKFLKHNKCHTIQGFLLSEPCLPSELEKLLKKI